MASSRTPLDWFSYQVGMYSFRAFAQGKATWILNYSWDGDQKVDRREAMMNLAASEIMAGANFWDAPGHSMAGSNDPPTRKKDFFLDQGPRENFLFSTDTHHPDRRLFFPPDPQFLREKNLSPLIEGFLFCSCRNTWSFKLSLRARSRISMGSTLILPDVRIMSDSEKSSLHAYVAGKTSFC